MLSCKKVRWQSPSTTSCNQSGVDSEKPHRLGSQASNAQPPPLKSILKKEGLFPDRPTGVCDCLSLYRCIRNFLNAGCTLVKFVICVAPFILSCLLSPCCARGGICALGLLRWVTNKKGRESCDQQEYAGKYSKHIIGINRCPETTERYDDGPLIQVDGVNSNVSGKRQHRLEGRPEVESFSSFTPQDDKYFFSTMLRLEKYLSEYAYLNKVDQDSVNLEDTIVGMSVHYEKDGLIFKKTDSDAFIQQRVSIVVEASRLTNGYLCYDYKSKRILVLSRKCYQTFGNAGNGDAVRFFPYTIKLKREGLDEEQGESVQPTTALLPQLYQCVYRDGPKGELNLCSSQEQHLAPKEAKEKELEYMLNKLTYSFENEGYGQGTQLVVSHGRKEYVCSYDDITNKISLSECGVDEGVDQNNIVIDVSNVNSLKEEEKTIISEMFNVVLNKKMVETNSAGTGLNKLYADRTPINMGDSVTYKISGKTYRGKVINLNNVSYEDFMEDDTKKFGRARSVYVGGKAIGANKTICSRVLPQDLKKIE